MLLALSLGLAALVLVALTWFAATHASRPPEPRGRVRPLPRAALPPSRRHTGIIDGTREWRRALESLEKRP